jgi:hypothetical protein
LLGLLDVALRGDPQVAIAQAGRPIFLTGSSDPAKGTTSSAQQ